MSEKKYSPEEIAKLAEGSKQSASIVGSHLNAPSNEGLTVRGTEYGTDGRGGKWLTTQRRYRNGAVTEHIEHTSPDGTITVTATVLELPSKKPA